jgi:hypothetical protein
VLAEAPSEGERLDTPDSCGLWLGSVITATTNAAVGNARRIRNVRTWLPDHHSLLPEIAVIGT